MNKKISFEFFPPKTAEGNIKLDKLSHDLSAFNPDYYSVTYGAGGTTRTTTVDAVLKIHNKGLPVAPHLSIGVDDEETVVALLDVYQQAGVNRIVALRGDAPSGVGGLLQQTVYAQDLVALIRREKSDYFEIFVACYPEIHPESANFEDDLKYFINKMNAGADAAITQYFYNPDSYFHYVEACQQQGMEKPIFPGIMPITNYTKLARFSDGCGAEIPRWIRKKLESYDDDQSIKQFGEEVVTKLCHKLLEGGAPGLHFYTMNQLHPTATIVNNLGLSD